MISLRGLSKRYVNQGRSISVLSDVSFDCQAGKITAVLGQSGAGKSTLLRCINALESPDSGQVMVQGDNVLACTTQALRQRRRDMGMVFQHYHLLQRRTVADNITLPLQLLGTPLSEANHRLCELLEATGLVGLEAAYPASLSGGQKQRVAIARALVQRPKILLCDEATSALDVESAASVIRLLQKLQRHYQLTMVFVTHDLSVVKALCDDVVLLEAGRVIEQASCLDFFSSPQSALAQRWLHKGDLTLPDAFEEHHLPILSLTFRGETTEQPVIASLVQRLGVVPNILRANIERVGEVPFGQLLMEVALPEDVSLAALLDFLQQRQVLVEVITRAGNT